jgi:ornithine cyclodeaminase/alanine dehydrogenase-like protein (mu-crystallin family)
MVDFIGIERIQELVARRGTARFVEELAREIEADFRRWEAFEKSPRHATHSSVGVIELMPACDGELYAFKYVNGHPKNTAVGLLTVTAFGVLRTSRPATRRCLGTDPDDRPARRHLGTRGAYPRGTRAECWR